MKVTYETLVSKGYHGSLDDLHGILEGVIAAPKAYDSKWLDMIQIDRPAELTELLVLYRDSYQSEKDVGFTDGPAPDSRIASLRTLMKNENISAFIVPRTDEYQGEYVPSRADRLLWLTGFAGSAGLAVIGTEKAAIFVDGRYTIQVCQQVRDDLFEFKHLIEDPYGTWLSDNFAEGDRVAYDPWLHSQRSVAILKKAAETGGFTLHSVTHNLIDQIWESQPAAPLSPVLPHLVEFAGEAFEEKLNRLAADMKKSGQDAAVITAPDCIAWLLNIRGQDVANCPLPLSFAVLHADGLVDLFADPRKVLEETRVHFGNRVSLQPIDRFEHELESLGQNGAKVLIDSTTAASAILDALKRGGAVIDDGPDPVLLPRATKNEVELNGTRAAHIRDGVAITKFLHWLSVTATQTELSELDVVEKLAGFRQQDQSFRDASFDTIAGAGPNGAVVHYRATEKTSRVLDQDNLLLVDSGGQYPDGTTDITRTIAIGTPTAEMKKRFTLVLKGHIAIACAKFPEGITGARLDSLARAPLWQEGLDYDHGTGHGVGSYLNVHEGPQRIATTGSTKLLPGMILSNEPGYYKTNEYGIRIENLVIVVEKGISADGSKKRLGFETITMAPIDRNLIEVELLNSQECEWLNTYHQEVCDKLSPLIGDTDVRSWLIEATQAI